MRVSDEDLSEAIEWRTKRDHRRDEGLDLQAMLDLRDARASVVELEERLDRQAPVIEAAREVSKKAENVRVWNGSPEHGAERELEFALDVLEDALNGKGE